jgi:lysophospholipase L1-like esterase
MAEPPSPGGTPSGPVDRRATVPARIEIVMRKLVWRALIVMCLGAVGACDEQTPTEPTSEGGTEPPPSVTNPPPSTATLNATRFLAFGASMTAGEVTAPMVSDVGNTPMVVVPSASFPAQLLDMLRSHYVRQGSEFTVTNAGQPGELIADGLPRLSQLLANSQTQVLLLLHGHNDLLNFGAGAVSPASARLNELAMEGRRRGARVFIGLLPPPIAGRQRSVPDSVVRDFNDRLRTIAAGEGAVVVDLYSALATDVTRHIGVDGHHPTEAGYRRMAEEFLARIAGDLEAR